MCGRYRLTAKERYLRDHFGLDVGVEWSPRWNIAPTQMIPPSGSIPGNRRVFSGSCAGANPVLGKRPVDWA
jgi:putative SOS response-associated peptidase YedK